MMMALHRRHTREHALCRNECIVNARRFYSKCNLVLGVLGFAITTYLRFPLYFQVACATRPQTVTMVIKKD